MIRPSSALVILASMGGIAHADLKVDPCACSANKPGFFRRGTLTGDWDDVRTRLIDDGIVIQGTYAGEAFAAPNLHDKIVIAGLAVLSLDLDLTKLVDDHAGAVHISGLGIHGNGLTAELMDIYGVSGNVAPSDVRLFEAWIEQPVKQVTLRAGLLAADQEFILARHSTALLNATFGIISQLSYNLQGPVYPVATPGASLRFETGEVTARGAIYDGTQSNSHGMPTGLGPESLVIGEVEYGKLVKVGAWHHSIHGNGYYAIVDHQLERYVGAFVRAGVSPSQTVSQYVDTGIRIGPGPFRKPDFIGIGVAFARTRLTLGAQTVLEATYQYQLGWLTIQPDVQLLLEHGQHAGIVATRVTIVF